MMDEDQQKLIAWGWELRLEEGEKGEKWFAVEPELLGVAAALYEAGWLQRRFSDQGSTEWRLTDMGLEALRTDAIREAHATPN
jgi:hypothetical protein